MADEAMTLPDWLRAEAAWAKDALHDPERLLDAADEIERLRATALKLVIIESPYAGDIDANVAYARSCVRDALTRGEAPIASHLLYTQPGILDDQIPSERHLGIDAGLAWRRVAEKTVVYTDRGISDGMKHGIAAAVAAGIPVEYRSLPTLSQ